jgi:pantetheine-phosphate adenylyltransferase
MNRVVYPGSFDPITNGHIDIIERGLAVFEHLTVAVAIHPDKTGLFSIEERIELIHKAVGHDSRIIVDSFEGLLVDYAQRVGASVVLRGLRAVSDFEYEFQMANMNRNLNSAVETCFMMTGAGLFYVSSSLVREVARLGADIDDLVHPTTAVALYTKYNR